VLCYTNCAPLIHNCTFADNSGPGLYLTSSPAEVVNCLFYGNVADTGGGIHLTTNSNALIVNCTITGNEASTQGGGICSLGCSPTIVNSIIHGNLPNQLAGSFPAVNYCNIEGGYDGFGNIDVDPGLAGPEMGNYALDACSPCIDAGNSNAYAFGAMTDLLGEVRLVDDPLMADTGFGLPPFVDIGACEYQADATGLVVAPAGDFTSAGPNGGPFDPASVTYTLLNYGAEAVEYSVAASQSWITVSSPAGVIPALDTAQVLLTINEEANSLLNGDHEANVDILNLNTGDGDTVRSVLLQVGVPEPMIIFTMDEDPGWSTEDLWAFGVPLGQGGAYGCQDPTAGFTGNNVYGYNLAGDYQNAMPERHLTTTPLDCSSLTRVRLKFRRWLGVEQPMYDHATIGVSSDGVAWTEVWTNKAEVADGAWVLCEYDIGAVADQQETVYVRWTMGVTDYAWQYCGWNIDDVEIWGVPNGVLCAGDLDGDGDTDQGDLGVLLAAYGLTGGGDLDGDGDTDQADLGVLLADYGCTPQ
jgi:Right handed beta helix region